MKTKSRTNDKYSHIEIESAYADMFTEAKEFFESAGCKFPDSPDIRRYAISIYTQSEPVPQDKKLKTTFSIRLSRDELVDLYALLTFGKNKNNVKGFIKCLNDTINNLYTKGCRVSWHIENGKHGHLSPERVIKIAAAIASRAIEYSLGGDYITDFGQLYIALGGDTGCKRFLEDIFMATELSIPDVKGQDVAVIKSIPDIKCYCCKFCRVSPTGIRTCGKVATAISGQQFDKHPDRYIDAKRNSNSGKLVSAVIDGRMNTCANFVSRVKID